MRKLRPYCLLLPLILAGCDSLIDDAANQMPVIGSRCPQGVCLTDSDAQHAQAYEEYKARQQQQQQQDNSGYYAPMGTSMQTAQPEDAQK